MKLCVMVFGLILLSFISTYEVVDYTNEPYVLVPGGDAYVFSERERIYHVFNV